MVYWEEFAFWALRGKGDLLSRIGTFAAMEPVRQGLLGIRGPFGALSGRNWAADGVKVVFLSDF